MVTRHSHINPDQQAMDPLPVSDAPKEPALNSGYIVTAVTAVIALLVAYGISITEVQQVAILGVISIIAPMVVAVIVRSKVVSPFTATKAANRSAKDGVPADPMQPRHWDYVA